MPTYLLGVLEGSPDYDFIYRSICIGMRSERFHECWRIEVPESDLPDGWVDHCFKELKVKRNL